MPEVLETNYQSIPDVEQGRPRVSWKRFSVRMSGNTSGAHHHWVSRLRNAGQIEVNPPVQSDYTLLFCPIASRVGTDIGEALENIPDVIVSLETDIESRQVQQSRQMIPLVSTYNKPIILVVMHHSFNSSHVVAESRRQVNDPRVHLVVDTLFFEGRCLESHLNENAWDEIKNFLDAEVPSRSLIVKWCSQHRRIIIAVVFVGIVILVGIVAGTLA